MKQLLGRFLLGSLAAIVVLYVGDWAVWSARVAMGGGMGTVQVGDVIVTPLKGNKEEYDWGGNITVPCSRSVFPQDGRGACWWLEQHPVIYER